MDFRQVAEGLFPCWCLALWIIYLVSNSEYKELLRVDKEGLIRFAKFLAVVTLARLFYFEFIASDAVLEGIKQISDFIPWPTFFGVFWEDACQALPLVIIGQMIADKKWLKKLYIPLIAIMSLVFGAMHSYEGLWAMITMAIYIPFTMNLGKKYGFGTIMICHVAYDLLTYFSFKAILGL